MKTLINYTLYDFIRSHKYFPPISTFIILIVVYYSYTPNPIIDSYAVTALMIYFISAWLCISVMALDPPVQRQVMILHIGGRNLYYLSKLITVWLLSLILTAFAFIYPIVFGMFNEQVTFTIGFISWMNYILLSTLGIVVASIFSKVIMENVVNSYGGLALTITFSFTALGIYEILPVSIKNIVWIFPPVLVTQKTLINWNGENIFHIDVIPFIWILLYAALLLWVFLKLVKRKG
ncbi:hypothetical protein [Paucisalibacillus sp. EB02]|uniref:hypothetical protein n=1 Tax=Paucisalibacillus sp. EB02 TaxID=1347087 RepID=UPI0004B0799F|nr:hypothetical protein [Paucisalibacillus sp. EB02]